MSTLEIIRNIIHYSLHFLAPGLIAFVFYRDQWLKAWLLLVITMLVDLDHLLATPVFDPDRCSVGFHFLHSYIAIGVYMIIFAFAKRRSVIQLLSLGLLLHMLTDFIDCKLQVIL